MIQAVVQEHLEKARSEAQEVCSLQGDQSPACAASWDVVEELQAALAHHREQNVKKSVFEDYCNEYPDADECRIYDI